MKYQADEIRLRAIYAQTAPLLAAGKVADVTKRLAPVVAEITKAGPADNAKLDEAAKPAAKKLDDYRRSAILALAVQARVREGNVAEAGTLLDLADKLGGSLESSVQSVAQLVAVVRPQIDALRKEGKAEDADKLSAGVTQILDKVAAKPAVSPGVKVYLGEALRTMGSFDKAAEVLQQVPAAPAEQMKLNPAALAQLPDEQKLAVTRYRNARLELARAYRGAKKFNDANAVLQAADGWGQQFRREALYLIEAKAADAPDAKAAGPLWGEAVKGWNALAGEYRPTLAKLAGGKQSARAALIVLAELKQVPPTDGVPGDPAEVLAGLRANPPAAWVAKATADADYFETMKNTLGRVEAAVKPQYFDLYFESTRCLTRANAALLSADMARLAAQFEKIADSLVKLEQANPDLAVEVRTKFAELLDEFPGLKEKYAGKGGKLLARESATGG